MVTLLQNMKRLVICKWLGIIHPPFRPKANGGWNNAGSSLKLCYLDSPPVGWCLNNIRTPHPISGNHRDARVSIYRQSPIFLSVSKSIFYLLSCKYSNFPPFLDSLPPFQQKSVNYCQPSVLSFYQCRGL